MRVFLLLFVILTKSAIAQPIATCEKGPSTGRILACTDLLREEQSSNKRAAIYRNRGQAYSWSRQYDLAIKDYDAALDVDPNDVEVRYERGWAFENVQQHDRAVADADHLIAMGEKARKVAVYQLRCRALAALGRLDEAIQSCTDQLRPFASQFFLVDRGEVYLLAGQYDRAIEDFDAALKIDKRMAHAKLGRGKAMFAKQDYVAALEEFDRANRMMETASGEVWPMALSKRGLANEALGRRPAAIADFQRALKAWPNLEESQQGLKRLGVPPTLPENRPWWRFW